MKTETTNVLTYVHSTDTIPVMAGYFQVRAALRTQFDADCREIAKLRSEQESVREAHLRFLDLQQQVEGKERRLLATGALLRDPVIEKQLASAGVPVSEGWRENIKLWRLIAEVARQFQKTQVVEVGRILFECGFETTRQSIESALRTHASRFRITRRGREKYVSLK